MILLSRMVTARSTNLRMKGLVIRVVFIPLVRITKKGDDYVWNLEMYSVDCNWGSREIKRGFFDPQRITILSRAKRIISTIERRELVLAPRKPHCWTTLHCSYLDIHISQKIRLCNGDFEDKFQASVQASIMNILIWKFNFIMLIFLLFFAGVVKSTAFCTQLLLFRKGWNVWVTFLHQIAIWICPVIGIARTVCKKQWIWQLLQKIEENWV